MTYGMVTPLGLDGCSVNDSDEPTGYVSVEGNGAQLYDWAHRPGAAWPCSSLAHCARVILELDADNGDIVDLTVYLPGDRYAQDSDDIGIPADELRAWSDDVLLSSRYAHLRGIGRGRGYLTQF